jgi:hypothetical protein
MAGNALHLSRTPRHYAHIAVLSLLILVSAAAIQAQAPPAPVLQSPANGATDVSRSPTLTWSASSGATQYDVYLGTTNPPPQAATMAVPYFPAQDLSANTTYYWKIVAKNSFGSASSAVWSFRTTPVTGPPVPPVLQSPANGATGVSLSPTLTWSASTGAATYDLHLGTSNPPPPYATGMSNTTTSYPAGPLNAGAAYYLNPAHSECPKGLQRPS